MPPNPSDRTTLVITQVYVPDPTAVGQYFAELARSLAARGQRVLVLTADAAYEDHKVRYPRRSDEAGVSVRRLGWSSFGKSSIPRRLLGAFGFLTQAALRGVAVPHLSQVVVSTSPPMCAAAGLFIAALRGVPLHYWVMDINPDQAVRLGKVRAESLAVTLFDWLNRQALQRAHTVVTLDRFMADTLRAKLESGRDRAMLIIPPWPLIEQQPLSHEANPFRRKHGFEGKRVVMYSGNHGPGVPLTTLLDALRRGRDLAPLCFAFIGGGLGKAEINRAVDAGELPRAISLPYQPLAELHASLSAADVHVVTLGPEMVGVIHPSKVYGALAVGRPILFIGPVPSHVSEMLAAADIGWHVDHGDVDGALEVLERIKAMPEAELARMGERAFRLASERFSRQRLCAELCDAFDGAPAEPAAHVTSRVES